MNVLTEQISASLEVLAETRGADRAFRFRGTALVQGALSRNGRYYPPEVVASAAAQAGETPLTVYARHRDALEGAGLPVGRVDRLYLDGRELKYEARLAPTRLGRDLQALIEGGFVVGASIRAFPYSSRRARWGDREVEWIDSLTLRGIDFTDDPGVPEAAGFTILEAGPVPIGSVPAPAPGSAAGHGKDLSMDLKDLTLDSLRAQRPDLVDAIAGEGARAPGGLLEEARSLLSVTEDAAIVPAIRELVALRTRQQIADYAAQQLGEDPLREVITRRLVEECASLAEARARLPREQHYLADLRRVAVAAPVGPAGSGLVENPETGSLTPEKGRARALVGLR
ncbi:MAG: hypothetical protein HY321_19085 [Armatimonadetes bacterium]|nr:hypothetical protein [Armatimonadota bacterium]